MNIAIIFGGGSGLRIHNQTPKQFIEVNGKPIIIYTIEAFDQNPNVDAIVVVCLEEWIPLLEKMLLRFSIAKVVRIVKGGNEGQQSIYNGLCAAEEYVNEFEKEDAFVLIHDAVRPLIDQNTINNSIDVARQKGNCITIGEPTETILQKNGDRRDICHKENMHLVRAPQVFLLKSIICLHRRAIADGKTGYKDCCSMLADYDIPFEILTGRMFNIKITYPTDLLTFKSLIGLQETKQILGI